jgi:hypothetical protein
MSLARLVTPAVLLATLALVWSAAAQPVGQATRCQPGQGSLQLVGCSLAEQLALAPGSASVSVIGLKSDRELPSPDALRERVRSAVAIALGERSAENKAGEPRKLRVELSIEKSGGALRVNADVRRATGLWQRIRHARPSAERHGFVETPLDAELRALIPPPPLVVSEVLKVKTQERIVALACGRLATDGGQELALVTRSSVRVGRIVGRAFAERKKAAWSALSAVAPTPLREPIASAEITDQGALRVGLTDRKDGLELSSELVVVQRFPGLLPVPGAGCVTRGGVGLLARFDSCTGPAGTSRTQPNTFDAVAGNQLVQLGRDLASGKLTGSRSELAQAKRSVGAQLAVGDADNDGSPELAFSADTLEPAKDRLTLVTISGNELTPRFELPVPGVSAIAICAGREGPGMAPVVVATADELWLIR